MGVKEAMLGEVADRPLRRTALARRIRRRHPLTRWKGLDTMVDTMRREGLLSTFVISPSPGEEGDRATPDHALHDDDASDPREDLTPVGLSVAGQSRLRAWLGRSTAPGTFRDDLLLQIAASEEDELPALEAMVRDRLATVTDLAAEVADVPGALTVKPEDWHRRRMRVVRTLDLSVLDGLARGLRRAHAEIVNALEQHPPEDR